MISIKKIRLFNSIEVRITGIAFINVIIGIVLFAFQFSLLHNLHNPESALYFGPQRIGVIDLFAPLFMASLTYLLCRRFASKILVNEVPTARFICYAFLAMSFYCCFCFYAVVCSIADPETRFSAQMCYIGIFLTALLNALIPIGEISWLLTFGKHNPELWGVFPSCQSEKARLLFLMLPLFVFLFTIPWLACPHLILLVVPCFL